VWKSKLVAASPILIRPDTNRDETIRARTIIWTAWRDGLTLWLKLCNVPLDRGGRVHVNPISQCRGHPEVYVAGDLSSFTHTKNKEPLPGLAPVALQEGKHAARNIMRTIQGLPRKPYRYFNKGSMATIGRARAVADFGKVHLSGLPAWLAWCFIHVYFLIGFYSRALVMFRWVYSYFTSNRGARLITGTACSSALIRTPDVSDSASKMVSAPACSRAISAPAATGSTSSDSPPATSTLNPASLNGAA
jgi:NADH dehydrogenase FAD-containing subunit